MERNGESCGSNLRSLKKPRIEEKGLTLPDPDLLDCPICFYPLTIPVYQCSSGHFACGPCCGKIRNKCPSCSREIGQIRCRGMEKVLESIKIPCQNMHHGCLENISYCKKLEHENICKYTPVSCVNMKHGCLEKVSCLMKLDHEKTCKYTPIQCPDPGCKFIGMFDCLYSHYVEKHPLFSKIVTFNTSKYFQAVLDEDRFLLQESDDKLLFVFTRVVDPLGSFINVTCVSLTVSDMKFSYDLTVTEGGNSISLKSSMELTPQCFQQPAKDKCLLVRNDFHRMRHGYKLLIVKLVIRKAS